MKNIKPTACNLPLLKEHPDNIEEGTKAETPSKDEASVEDTASGMALVDAMEFTLEQETVSRVPRCEVYYHRISRRFWLWDEKRGRIFEMTRTQIRDRLMQSGLSKRIQEDHTTSEVTDALIKIERTMWVDEVDFADPSPHLRYAEEDGNVVLCVGEYHAKQEEFSNE